MEEQWDQSSDEKLAQAYQPAPGAGSESRSSGRCLLYGCLLLILFALASVICAGLTTWWFVREQVTRYTSDQPAVIPVVNYSEEELAEVQQRVDEFRQAVEQGETPEDLVLTADDINALISKDPDLRGKVFVRIDEGQISGDISIPTDGIPGGEGRFFNASATFDVSLEQGVLIVRLATADVNGRPVPNAFLEGMRQENLAKDAYQDPEVAETLRRFRQLIIEDDKIILKPQPAEAQTPQESPAAMEAKEAENSPP